MSATNNIADRPFQPFATDNDGTEKHISPFDWPRIRISNEAELHLQLKELDEDNEEWRLLAYAEEDKGLLESSSQAGSCCNAAYLKAIRHNLAIANMACQLEIDAEYALMEDVVMATKEELSRLQRHPELFPSKDIKEEFWHNVRLTANHSVKYIIPKQEARDHAHRTLQAARVEFEEDMRSPGRDMHRKPWEQFLHNRRNIAKEGSAQILPMATARLLTSYLDEHKAIIHDIEAQREDLKPYGPSSSRNYLCSNELKRTPDGHMRSHKAFPDLLKPTVAGPINIVRHGDMNKLETLNLDFAALNGRRPPLRPRMWNCTCVLIQDYPNYGVDSEQRNERVEEMMSMFT